MNVFKASRKGVTLLSSKVYSSEEGSVGRGSIKSSRRAVDEEEAQLAELAEGSRRRGGSIGRARGGQSTKRRLNWQRSRGGSVDEEEAQLAELAGRLSRQRLN